MKHAGGRGCSAVNVTIIACAIHNAHACARVGHNNQHADFLHSDILLAIPAMAKDSSTQIFHPRKYLDRFYYSIKKPGEEPELLEFILIKLHQYMKEGQQDYIPAKLLIMKLFSYNVRLLSECLTLV